MEHGYFLKHTLTYPYGQGSKYEAQTDECPLLHIPFYFFNAALLYQQLNFSMFRESSTKGETAGCTILFPNW